MRKDVGPILIIVGVSVTGYYLCGLLTAYVCMLAGTLGWIVSYLSSIEEIFKGIRSMVADAYIMTNTMRISSSCYLPLSSIPSQVAGISYPKWGPMCEVIEESQILIKPDGTHPTAQEIMSYSSRGDIGLIYSWFIMASGVTARLREAKEQ